MTELIVTYDKSGKIVSFDYKIKADLESNQAIADQTVIDHRDLDMYYCPNEKVEKRPKIGLDVDDSVKNDNVSTAKVVVDNPTNQELNVDLSIEESVFNITIPANSVKENDVTTNKNAGDTITVSVASDWPIIDSDEHKIEVVST